jgi:hypothetical protein
MEHKPKTAERTYSSLISEMREEFKQFATTRFQMLRAELKERSATLKVAGPLVVVGAVLIGTSYLTFTFSLVALVAAFFRNSPFGWFYAAGMVALFFLVFGGIAIYFAVREFKSKPWTPKRTLEIVKGDILWIKAETKGQI